MSVLPVQNATAAEEYLAMERISPVRHEYHRGNIYQMAGASAAHEIICVNLSTSLNNQLKGRNCHVYSSNLRVHIESTGLYTYPDLSAVCGESVMVDDDHLDNLVNPTLIVEVLSRSTAQYDTGAKLDHYRSIESLRHYLLVWQDLRRAMLYSRRDNEWAVQDYIGGEASIDLPAIGCTVSMADIYDKVTLKDGRPTD